MAAFGLSSWEVRLRSGLERHDAVACSESAGSPAYSKQTPLSCHPEERSDERSAVPSSIEAAAPSALSAANHELAADFQRIAEHPPAPPPLSFRAEESTARNPSYAFAARNPEERSREAASPACAAQKPISRPPEQRSDDGSASSVNVPQPAPPPSPASEPTAPAATAIGPGITLTRIGHTVDWWAPPSWSGRPRRDASTTRNRGKNSGWPDISRMTSYAYRHWQHAQQSPSHWMP